MKLAFSGCRNTYVDVRKIMRDGVGLVQYWAGPDLHMHVLVGDARGVDLAVRDFFHPDHRTVFRADWKTLGRAAGPERNGRMIAEADALIALPSKLSTGTWNAIKQARDKGIPILVLQAEKYETDDHLTPYE